MNWIGVLADSPVDRVTVIVPVSSFPDGRVSVVNVIVVRSRLKAS